MDRPTPFVVLAMLAASLFAAGDATAERARSHDADAAAPSHLSLPSRQGKPAWRQVGRASWYGPWHQRRLTANGERFDQAKLTAAHRSLPFNSWVRVTNLENHRIVVVRINDRGPYVKGRIIDLTSRAARDLGMKEAGTSRVRIDVIPDAEQLERVADAR